jgi:lysophospholipase L1-like esterase
MIGPSARAAVALIVVSGCFAAAPPPPPPSVSTVRGGADPKTREIRYLAMGDSITQGIGSADFESAAFPARLAALWRAKGCKVELKNVAVAGYTAVEILSHEVPEIESFNPTFITLQVGANDIANNVRLETFRLQVRLILAAARRSGARVVVLPSNEFWRAPQGASYGAGRDVRDAFDAALIEETTAQKAELVDLRLLYRQHADKKSWADDGIHPTAACYAEMAAELGRVIAAPCK